MQTIRAVFENGVFRPSEKVDLPENCEVEFEFKVVQPPSPPPRSHAAVYEILSRSYETGQPDIAARHSEHQP